MKIGYYLLVLLAIIVNRANCLAEEPDITYESLYQWGKEAYTSERWYECVAFMKRALEDYKYFQSVVIHCQKKCHKLVPIDPLVLNDRQMAQKSIYEVRFFEKVSQKSLCLQRCTNDRFASRPSRPVNVETIDNEFERLVPYSYMQFCYWKLHDLDHAVSAAYTFFVHNQEDTMMTDNLKFYSTQAQFSVNMYKDQEEHEFQPLYEKGVEAYEKEDFLNAVINFENSLEAYVKSYEDCRYLCINPYTENSTSLDFYTAITKHFGNVLKCRNRCTSKLSFIKGREIKEFLPLHFNYLQFAYWKTSRSMKACEAIGTYLVFLPDDETMIQNKNYFMEKTKVKEEAFNPRPEMVRLHTQQVLDIKMLKYLDEKFKYENKEFSPEHADDYNEIKTDDESWEQLLEEFEKVEESFPAPDLSVDDLKYKRKGNKGDLGGEDYKKMMNHGSKNHNPTSSKKKRFQGLYTPPEEVLNFYKETYGITVSKKENELNGTLRFIADNLISASDCQQLLTLKALAVSGSGYSGKSSPHTEFENFDGLTIGKLTELVEASKVSLDIGKMFYDKSELARELVEKYFNLSSHLYVDYTHFVCRSTRADKSGEARTDLSHPIHGDNCMLRDGRCDKTSPAFTWRDFSAIVYLNDDFDGGEFIFADNDYNVEAVLKPKCGQMVAFTGDTLHGVKAVTKGTRCVLALWMTLDPEHQEKERMQAQQTFAQLEIARAQSAEIKT